MKKLLVIMLVLGLASAANAIELKISVNGEVDIPDSQVNICPSDVLTLDIWGSGYSTPAEDAWYIALVVDTTTGSITGGQAIIPPAPDWSTIYGQSAAADYFPCLGPTEDGPWGEVSAPPGGTAGPGVYFDRFDFHCVAEGDAVVRLIGTQDFGNCTVFDTLIIHQVPEPASMLLLGLGGLLLRRRR